MSQRGEQEFELQSILRALGRSARPLLLLVAAVVAVSAAVFAFSPRRYEGTTVLVPVQGSRPRADLAGAASLLGGAIDFGSSGFDATRDVVAYLLRSRTVLLAAASTPYAGRPLALAIVNREPRPGENDEVLLTALRRKVRVTTSKETGFVTLSIQAGDSGAVRAFIGSVVRGAQRLFADVAQSQAGELVRAQERRLDSARAELRRAEDILLRFDESNRVVSLRGRLSLDRARLERDATDAARVYEEVVADRQAAIAHQLEDAPALALVEKVSDPMPPKPRQVLFRSLLLGLMVGVAGLLALAARELARRSAGFEAPAS